MALLTLSCWVCTAAPRSCSFWFAFATAATRDPMVSGPPGSAAAIPPDWENTVASSMPTVSGTAQTRPHSRDGEARGVRLIRLKSPKARERKAHSFGTQSQKSHK